MGRKKAWDGKGSDRCENRFHRSGRHGQAHGGQPAEGRAVRDGLQPFSGRGRRTRPGWGGGGAIAARPGRALRCRHHDAPGLAGRPVGPLRSGRHSGGADPGEGRRGHELGLLTEKRYLKNRRKMLFIMIKESTRWICHLYTAET